MLKRVHSFNLGCKTTPGSSSCTELKGDPTAMWKRFDGTDYQQWPGSQPAITAGRRRVLGRDLLPSILKNLGSNKL